MLNYDLRDFTAAATLTDHEEYVPASTNSSAFTITLPTAVGRMGKSYTVLKTNNSASVVTIAAQFGETINRAASYGRLSAQ